MAVAKEDLVGSQSRIFEAYAALNGGVDSNRELEEWRDMLGSSLAEEVCVHRQTPFFYSPPRPKPITANYSAAASPSGR